MTTPLPTGPLSLSAYKLRRMLGLSATWIAELATIAEADPLARIHYFTQGLIEDTLPRPAAVVTGDDLQWALQFGGAQNWLRPSGGVTLWMGQDVLPAHYNDQPSALIRFSNLFGMCLQDIVDLAAADQTADSDVPDSHLTIVNVNVIGVSENPEEQWPTVGRFMWGAVTFQWGDSG